MATKLIAGRKFQAKLVLRNSFRKRSITPREIALVSLAFDRIWRNFEQCEGRATLDPTAGTSIKGGAI